MLSEHPSVPGRLVVKRLLALPGDTVLAPSHLDAGCGCHIEQAVTLPEGCVWLSGDNLACSLDSRAFGPVPYQLLMGRLLCKVCLSPCPAVRYGRMPSSIILCDPVTRAAAVASRW